MRKRGSIVLAVTAIAVLGGAFLWTVTRPPAVPDPVYNGHPLSYWVKSQVTSNLVLDANAVPYLVQGLKADGRLRKTYNRLWYHLPAWARFRLPTPMATSFVRQTSCILLGNLGTNAKPAIPDLIRLSREDFYMGRVMAVLALGKIARSEDTAAVQALVAMTKDTDPTFGEIAVAALTTADPQAIPKAGVTNSATGPSPTTAPAGSVR